MIAWRRKKRRRKRYEACDDVVRVARFERAASSSQSWRPTDWATPGYQNTLNTPTRGEASAAGERLPPKDRREPLFRLRS